MNRRKLYLDAAERISWTALQSLLAAWLVLGDFSAATFKVAGAAGLVSAAKCILATRIGEADSASTVPAVT